MQSETHGADSAEIERLRDQLSDLELSDDMLTLRTPYDGDVNGDTGQHIVVGGEVVVTFEDSELGDAARQLFTAALRTSPENAVKLREAVDYIELGANQWKNIANAAEDDFVCVSVYQFLKAAESWRFILGIVPQTEHVAEVATPLEEMFRPPTDIDEIARAALKGTPTDGE